MVRSKVWSFCVLELVILVVASLSGQTAGKSVVPVGLLVSSNDVRDCVSGRTVREVYLEVTCGDSPSEQLARKATGITSSDTARCSVGGDTSSPDPGICYIQATSTDDMRPTVDVINVELDSDCQRENKTLKKQHLCVEMSPDECQKDQKVLIDVTTPFLQTVVNKPKVSLLFYSARIKTDPNYVKILGIRTIVITEDTACDFSGSCNWKLGKGVDISSSHDVDRWCKSCQENSKLQGKIVVVKEGTTSITSPRVYGCTENLSLQMSLLLLGNSSVTVRNSLSSKEIWRSRANTSGALKKIEIPLPDSCETFTLTMSVTSADNDSLVAIGNISFTSQEGDSGKQTASVQKLTPRFCDFGEPCTFITDITGVCELKLYRGDPRRRLRDPIKKKYGSFLYTEVKEEGDCSPYSDIRKLEAAFQTKAITPLNDNPCKVSLGWYGESYWDLRLRSIKDSTTKSLVYFTHTEKRTLQYLECTIANETDPYTLEFKTDNMVDSEYMGLDFISLSEGCVFADEVEDVNVSVSTDMIVSRQKEDGHSSVVTTVLIPTVLVITCLAVLVTIGIATTRRKRNARDLSLLQRENPNDRQVALSDLLLQQTTQSALQDILTERNPNYEWFSERFLNGTIRDYDRSRIRTESIIGRGAFGEVYKGTLLGSKSDEADIQIAIKQLPNGAKENSKSDFLFEALTLCKFQHKNIVKCLGISTDNYGIYILLELMLGGDLKSFLKHTRDKETKRPTLSVREMLSLALDIAAGCSYLEVNKFVHRDIAARNCLLTTRDSGRVAKIADFGLARDVVMSDYYRKEGQALLPVRWMSPESFHDGIFSTKSDAWAFGILMWEIFTSGFIPYPGLSNFSVLNFVCTGGRLESPVVCPSYVYNTMMWCWSEEPQNRPTFKQIIDDLELANKIYTDCSLGVSRSKTKENPTRSPRYYSKSAGSDESSTVMLIDDICHNGV